MPSKDFTTTILVDQILEKAFEAINNVRGWWSEDIEGSTDKLNSEFTYQYKDIHYCKIEIVELIPDKKVVWFVKYNYFNFPKDKTEWTNTRICFDISTLDNKTQIRFTHIGLVPEFECFDLCSTAWTGYINGSLRNLITTGKGQPNARSLAILNK